MLKLFLVGLGGFIGTLLRYGIAELVSRRYGNTFPLGTLIVNAVGCLLAGSLLHLIDERFPINPTAQALIFIGLLGGFTTFSAYGLQTLILLKEGEVFLALLNILASNIACLFFVWFGYSVAKAINF